MAGSQKILCGCERSHKKTRRLQQALQSGSEGFIVVDN